jgi:GAF domain-containing protein
VGLVARELPLADELGAVFARMSGVLLSRETVRTALSVITELAAETFPATAGSGITLMDERGARVTAAATDEVVERADALQYQLGEGPCLTAWQRRTVVRVDDMSREGRWPRWVPSAVELGLRCVLSAPLVAGADALGALKLYAARPFAYTQREEHLLAMFASQAAVLLANVRTARDAERVSDQLRDSMRARDVISLAKGIIMARDGVDERTAFVTLVDLAAQEGHPLRHAAERLAQSTVRRRR